MAFERIREGREQPATGEDVEDHMVSVQAVGDLSRRRPSERGCPTGVAGCGLRIDQPVESTVGPTCAQARRVLQQAAFGPVPAEFGERV